MSIINNLEKYNTIDDLIIDQDGIIKLIKKSLEVKKTIVIQDPLDTHLRHILNLGHTFAHALELSKETDLYHGECVAIGILVNVKNNEELYSKIKNIFSKFDCIREFPKVDLDKIFNDKKRLSNKIKEVYLTSIGKCEIVEVECNDLIKEMDVNYQSIIKDYKLFKPYFMFSATSLNGDVYIPTSKSALHRYLIAAALSKTEVILTGIDKLNNDALVTIECLKYLDTKVEFDEEKSTLKVYPYQYNHEIKSINMKESGTSLRVTLPLLINYNDNILITGENKLPERPLKTYLDIFEKQSIEYDRLSNNYLPLKINGKIKPGDFYLKENTSSQFISGLLFLLPLLDGDSTIICASTPESLPYILMSIETLKDFGVEIQNNNDYTKFIIKGNQQYTAKKTYVIEQDYSSRCFFEVAKDMSQHNITIKNKITPTLQGDAIVVDIIKNKIKTIDLKDVPDTAPIMAIHYAINGGLMINTDRLKYKESDRLQAIMDYLDIMKINYVNKNNTLSIESGLIHGGIANTYNDHRITMSLIIASTIATTPICISEIKSINKSFPTFINQYERLGGFVDEK